MKEVLLITVIRASLKESNVDKIIFLNYNQMYDKYLK